MGDLSKGGFDYSALSPQEAERALADAEWVRARFRQAEDQALEAAAEIGARMLNARETVGHGRFLPWIKAEFPFSVQTAHNMMNVAANLPSGKFQTVGNLPLRVVYALVAPTTPEPLRQQVIGDLEAKRIEAPHEVWDRIQASRAEARQRRADAKRTPGQRAYRRKVAKTVEQEERERQKRIAERNALIAEAIGMLQDRFGADLPAFLAVLQKVDLWDLRHALQAVAEQREVA